VKRRDKGRSEQARAVFIHEQARGECHEQGRSDGVMTKRVIGREGFVLGNPFWKFIRSACLLFYLKRALR